MSDKLNEKFEELVTAQKVIVEDDQSKMPTVQATVIPGTGSEPTQVSDAQTGSGGKDPMPTVDAGKSMVSLLQRILVVHPLLLTSMMTMENQIQALKRLLQ